MKDKIKAPLVPEHPYKTFPQRNFWKTGLVQQNPFSIDSIYKKKFDISHNDKICTAGSCFAQHITKRFKAYGFNVIDNEPPPNSLPESEQLKHGFSQYSCRYGNIYTVRQLLQLSREALGEFLPSDTVWSKNNLFFDALRPNVFPGGIHSEKEVVYLRKLHLSKVKDALMSMDLLVFTLGLTEAWQHSQSGTVFPSCPGVIAGSYDDSKYSFVNFDYSSILEDFIAFLQLLQKYRENTFKVILTVSPVPLTATASSLHILPAAIYSKSVLRAVAGCLSSKFDYIDYFPSFEIVNNPMLNSIAFESNYRSVKPQIVDVVMNHMFKEHLPPRRDNSELSPEVTDVLCEEMLLEEFA